MNPWKPIKTYRRRNRFMHKVDLWLAWGASPMTMGFSDSFRVVEAWQDTEGRWLHYGSPGKVAELNRDYITHWMSLPLAPKVP
jgi:hypothetical protein